MCHCPGSRNNSTTASAYHHSTGSTTNTSDPGATSNPTSYASSTTSCNNNNKYNDNNNIKCTHSHMSSRLHISRLTMPDNNNANPDSSSKCLMPIRHYTTGHPMRS